MLRQDILPIIQSQRKREKKAEKRLKFPFTTKVIKAGNFYQLKTYSHSIDPSRPINRTDYDKDPNSERTETSLNRTRNNAMLLIESNLTPYSKLITFTLKEPIYDLDEFNKQWKFFLRRFQRAFGYKFPYLKVIEGQKKRQATYNLPGAPLHAHAIVFLDRFIPVRELAKVWNLGNIDIKKVKSSDVGRYLMKYITKDTEFMALNKKGYHRSHNLKQPISITFPDNMIPLDYDFHKTYTVKHPTFTDMTCQMYEKRIDAPLILVDVLTGEISTVFHKKLEKRLSKMPYNESTDAFLYPDTL